MRRKLALRVGVSLVVAFLVLELALRFLLFGPGDLGSRFRKGIYYANYGTDTFWALEGVFGQEQGRQVSRRRARLGEQAHRPRYLRAQGRGAAPGPPPGSPVRRLLLGLHDGLGGLLPGTAPRFRAGHGALHAQLRRLWPRRRADAPDDAEDARALRGPKPDRHRGHLRRRRPDAHAPVLAAIPQAALPSGPGRARPRPPIPGGREAWYAAHGLGVTCYAWSFLLHSGVLPNFLQARASGRFRLRQEIKELNSAVLAAIARELEARNLEGFVLLMPGLPVLEGDWSMDWQEPYLRDVLAELGLPYVEARREIEADAALHGGYRELFIQGGSRTRPLRRTRQPGRVRGAPSGFAGRVRRVGAGWGNGAAQRGLEKTQADLTRSDPRRTAPPNKKGGGPPSGPPLVRIRASEIELPVHLPQQRLDRLVHFVAAHVLVADDALGIEHVDGRPTLDVSSARRCCRARSCAR